TPRSVKTALTATGVPRTIGGPPGQRGPASVVNRNGRRHAMTRSFPAALAATLLLAGGARAGFVPSSQLAWSYDCTPGSPFLAAHANPAAGVRFSDKLTGTAVGSQDVFATFLRTESTATAGSPDTLGAGGYSLTLSLTTHRDGQEHSASLTLTGSLGGTFSAEDANVTNDFWAPTWHSVDLDTYTFSVSLLEDTPPGPPGQASPGSITARV